MSKPRPSRKPAKKPFRSILGMTGQQFDALSDAERQKIYDEIDNGTPEQRLAESRPLTPAEQREWDRYREHGRKGSAGRPKLGPRGVKVIALSVEQGLLERADAYARQRGLKRAEFFSQAITAALAS